MIGAEFRRPPTVMSNFTNDDLHTIVIVVSAVISMVLIAAMLFLRDK
jgi:hypothetical protein